MRTIALPAEISHTLSSFKLRRRLGVRLQSSTTADRSTTLSELAWVMFICCALLSVAKAQTNSVTIIQQSIQAQGGANRLSEIQDLQGSGSVVYYWAGQEVKGTASIQMLGNSAFRLDSSVAGKDRSLRVYGPAAAVQEPDGSRRGISATNASVYWCALAPIVELARASSPRVLTASPAVIDGKSVIRIPYIRELGVQSVGASSSDTSVVNLYFDSTTFLLLRVEAAVSVSNSEAEKYLVRIDLGDYRDVGGVMLPFMLTERMGDQRLWSLRVDSYSLNTGIQKTEFSF